MSQGSSHCACVHLASDYPAPVLEALASGVASRARAFFVMGVSLGCCAGFYRCDVLLDPRTEV